MGYVRRLMGKPADNRECSPSRPLPSLELALDPARLPVRAFLQPQPGLDRRAERMARHPHVGQVGRHHQTVHDAHGQVAKIAAEP